MTFLLNALQLVASGSSDTLLKLWDVSTGNEIDSIKREPSPITTVAFSPDGKLVASTHVGGYANNKILIWDISTGKLVSTFGHDGGNTIGSLSFSPDGKLLVTTNDFNDVEIKDVSTGQVKTRFRGGASLAFSPDSKLLSTGGNDGKVNLYDVTTGKYLTSLVGHNQGDVKVTFNPTGKTLASGNSDGEIRIWLLSDYLKSSGG